MVSKKLFIVILFFTLLFPTQSHAITGTDVWETDGYIDYIMNFSEIRNPSQRYVYKDLNQVSATNIEFKGSILSSIYTGRNHTSGELNFKFSASNKFIEKILLGDSPNKTYPIPEIGFNEETIPNFFFINTSNWRTGYKTQATANFVYEDVSGIHSQLIYYLVEGESSIEVKVNHNVRRIPTWDIGINLVILYSINGTNVIDHFSSSYKITKNSGVTLTNSIIRIIENNGSKVYHLNIEFFADSAFNVNFFSSGNQSIFEFKDYIFKIYLLTVILYILLKGKSNRFLNI